MTNDDLAAAFLDLFDETHAKVNALPDGPDKIRADRLLSMFHHAGNVFAQHCADIGEIQPLDGTGKPPPGH